MKQTVIGEIYYSLSSKELRQLDVFLSTSRWQYSETIIRCHEYFCIHTTNNSWEAMNKALLFEQVYGEEEFNDGKLRFVLTRLLEALKEWKITEEINKNNVFVEKIWIDFIVEKKLRKNILYSIEKPDKASSSEYRYLERYFKSQENSIFQYLYSKDVKQQYHSIVQSMKDAELFADLVFIKNYFSLLNFSNIYQSVADELPQQKLDEIKEKAWDKIYPEFEIYQNLLELLTHRDDSDYYYRYKTSLFANFDIWNEEEKVNFLVALLNYTTNQINRGNTTFIDEQYELFEYFEANDIFKIKSYINTGRINNVVFIYLRKREFKKAELFLKKYSEFLLENQRESCFHFNISRIYFENNRFKDSLKELLKVDFGHDSWYSVNSKLLLLKNYFELKETDAFASLCISFKEYVKKNKVISDSHKISLSNFIKIIRKIYDANPNKLKKLRKDLEESKQIAEKAWLLGKIDDGRNK